MDSVSIGRLLSMGASIKEELFQPELSRGLAGTKALPWKLHHVDGETDEFHGRETDEIENIRLSSLP